MTHTYFDPYEVENLHAEVRRALGNKNRFWAPDGAQVIVSHRYEKPVFFTINNEGDRIHKRQGRGHFFEDDQLEFLAKFMPEGGTFCDIGANIGNHSLYMLLFGGAARALAFEPNPKTLRLFMSNMILNGVVDRVALDLLGYGLSEEDDEGWAINMVSKNLGQAKLKKSGGSVPVRKGDTLIGDTNVDLIKIDVEGMEMGALAGLEATVARCRPPIFIEVDHENRDAFDRLMMEWKYQLSQSFPPARNNQNLLLVPAERAEEYPKPGDAP